MFFQIEVSTIIFYANDYPSFFLKHATISVPLGE